MEDGAEYSGRTVEDAITNAERHLGVPRGALKIEIITPGRSGVFGIGAEPARIRAAVIRVEPAVEEVAPVIHTDPAETTVTTSAPISAPAATAVIEEEAEGDDRVHEPSIVSGDLPAAAQTVLQELLTSMGFDADVSVRSEADPIMLAISGENLGVLIGRRGDNLAALQFMVNLILSKNRRQWPRIVIDVENYRARREESLRTLASRIAYRVRRNQRPFTLEAMPASDRRIIHLSLRDETDVETYSIGEGVARRVVVAPRRTAPVPVRERYS